jgi:ammonia channel protein AmtB
LFVEQPSSQVNVPGGAVDVLDYAGGLIVEIVSGSSALALALVLGDRFCVPALTAPQ